MSPSEKKANSATVVISAAAGRCRTQSPKRRQSPRDASRSSSGRHATVLRRGQKPPRPYQVSSAGRSVRPANRTDPTPIAETGPSPFVEPAWESSSTSIAAMTVQPLASSAGPARRIALAIASCLSSTR